MKTKNSRHIWYSDKISESVILRAMARLLLLLVPIVVSSTDFRGDVPVENDELYNQFLPDDSDINGCGGLYENGLNPDCESVYDADWCNDQCRTVGGDQNSNEHPLCYDKCPLYSKEDLNISVTCATSQSVMEFDLSKLDNSSLDTNQMSVSIIMQVITFPHISIFYIS